MPIVEERMRGELALIEQIPGNQSRKQRYILVFFYEERGKSGTEIVNIQQRHAKLAIYEQANKTNLDLI